MSRMKIFSKVLGSVNNFKKFILDSIKDRLNTKIFSRVKDTQSTIRDMILDSIRNQPEYSSLKAGELRHALGVQNPATVDAILSVLESMDIKIKRPTSTGSGVDAKITINMVRDGFADLLAAPAASYISENGFDVNWLEWLLLRGNDSVVVGYSYFPEISPRSRTGLGLMVKSGNSAIFRVPSEYAGTVDNNWITRGIDEALPKIQAYINQMVEQSL